MEFKNKYIFTLDIDGDLSMLERVKLPRHWKDADSNTYSNFNQLGGAKLRQLGWYKVMEEHQPVSEYDTEIKVNTVYNTTSKRIEIVFNTVRKELVDVRKVKIRSLRDLKTELIETFLENNTIDEQVRLIYKNIGKLILAFSKPDPNDFVNNNTFLQNTLTTVDTINDDIGLVNDRIDLAKVEVDIETLILI